MSILTCIQDLGELAALVVLVAVIAWIRHRRQQDAYRWAEGASITSAAAQYLVEERFGRAAVAERGSMDPADREALRLLVDKNRECESSCMNMEPLPR